MKFIFICRTFFSSAWCLCNQQIDQLSRTSKTLSILFLLSQYVFVLPFSLFIYFDCCVGCFLPLSLQSAIKTKRISIFCFRCTDFGISAYRKSFNGEYCYFVVVRAYVCAMFISDAVIFSELSFKQSVIFATLQKKRTNEKLQKLKTVPRLRIHLFYFFSRSLSPFWIFKVIHCS